MICQECGTVAAVLGQAHTPWRQSLSLAIVALAILAIPAVGGADPSQTATSLRSLDAQLVAKQRSAVLGLYSLDRRLADSHTRLTVLEGQAASLQAQRVMLGRELSIARQGSRIAQARLNDRLRTLYEQGKVSPLEILFGARSLDQALSDLNNLSSTASVDEDVVRQLHTARRALAETSSSLETRRIALAGALRQAQATDAALVATRSQRSSYIASLANQRRLNEGQVSRLVAQASAASRRSSTLLRAGQRSASGAADSPESVSDISPTPQAAQPTAVDATPGGRTFTVTATGYSLKGTTATGLPVGWGIAAVDPAVIPLGTHMTIPGYGEAVAADTGGAVGGATIDLWFPTVAAANAWGRRTVTISLH